MRAALLTALFLPALGGPLRAQAGAGAAPAPPAATQAPAGAAGPAVQATSLASRASWFSDRRPIRVGDILTVVIDEAVNARERQNLNAQSRRGQEMGLNLNVSPTVQVGPQKGFETKFDAASRNTAEANRTGDLTGIISVRVTAVEPTGAARIKGEKSVVVDGRKQVIDLEGVVRPEDVNAQNAVSSSRVAEAVISYKGKKIGPSKGILGSILSIFWP